MAYPEKVTYNTKYNLKPIEVPDGQFSAENANELKEKVNKNALFHGIYDNLSTLQATHPNPPVGAFAYLIDGSHYRCVNIGWTTNEGSGSASSYFKGYHLSLAALKIAHPVSTPGSRAIIKVEGANDLEALWDEDDQDWFAFEFNPTDFVSQEQFSLLEERVTTLEQNPGGGSSSIRRYLTIAAMLSDQANQPDESVCVALDASADPTVDAGYAYYEYLGTTNGTLADYRKLSEEESMDVDSGGLDVRMANLVADLSTAEKDAIKAKLGITEGGGIQIIDAGAFTGQFNVSDGNYRYYDDYKTGSILGELSVSVSKQLGSQARVVIKGDFMGTLPSAWRFSGQPITNNPAKVNELTVEIGKGSVVNIVNRIFDFIDSEAPTTPTNLVSPSKTDTSVDLTWDASTDDVGVSGYNIYNGGALEKQVGTNAGTLSGLSPSTSYSFTVSALDAQGNESDPSAVLIVETNSVPALEPEYQAVLDYASINGYDLPDTTQQVKDNNKVKYLKTVGAWAELDTIRIFNAIYSPTSWAKNFYRLNFKSPGNFTLNADTGLEPAFVSGSGFKVLGGSGKFAKTGFIPSTNAVNFTATNSSQIWGLFDLPASFTSAAWVIGGRAANDNDQILIGIPTDGHLVSRVGSSDSQFDVSQGDLNSHFHTYKNGTEYKTFRNGTIELASSSAIVLGGISTVEQYILGANNAGSLLGTGMDLGMKYHLTGSALNTLKVEVYEIMNEIYVP